MENHFNGQGRHLYFDTRTVQKRTVCCPFKLYWDNLANSAVNGIRYFDTATTQERRVTFNTKILENIN